MFALCIYNGIPNLPLNVGGKRSNDTSLTSVLRSGKHGEALPAYVTYAVLRTDLGFGSKGAVEPLDVLEGERGSGRVMVEG